MEIQRGHKKSWELFMKGCSKKGWSGTSYKYHEKMVAQEPGYEKSLKV
jgi:hypothetical protein